MVSPFHNWLKFGGENDLYQTNACIAECDSNDGEASLDPDDDDDVSLIVFRHLCFLLTINDIVSINLLLLAPASTIYLRLSILGPFDAFVWIALLSLNLPSHLSILGPFNLFLLSRHRLRQSHPNHSFSLTVHLPKNQATISVSILPHLHLLYCDIRSKIASTSLLSVNGKLTFAPETQL